MASKATYFLGIDGGGSKCKVRLENENGLLLMKPKWLSKRGHQQPTKLRVNTSRY